MDNQTSNVPLFVVSGPSGSGKTTICRKIAQDYGWYFSVSHTTRPQRENEVNGVDYFFVSKDEFLKMVDHGDLLEWAQVYDNYYGTSKANVMNKIAQGQGVIFDVDTQGAASIKNELPSSILIFLKTPDIDVLKDRLENRGRDSSQEIQKRIQNAENEISHINEYDHVVMNDDLDQAIKDVKMIIEGH